MNRRITALLLLSMMVSNVFIVSSCVDNSSNSNKMDTTQESVGEKTSVEETKLNDIDKLPNKDYGGESFRTITENNIWWQLTDITADEISGDVVNDAIYQRNSKFESKFNVKLDVKYGEKGSAYSAIRTSVLAQDNAYDFVIPSLTDAAKLAEQGLLCDMKKIKELDLSNSAWDQNGVDQLSIGNKLYYTVSDISLGRNEAIWIYMFNKKLANTYNIENLYQLVKDGKWTFDKYYEIANKVSKDLDGDSKITKADQFGTITHGGNSYGLMVASGETIAKKDENDLPYLDLYTPRFVQVYDEITKIMADSTNVAREDKFNERTEVIFNSDRALFCGQVLSCVRLYRSMESDFGILPTPKFDESQKDYATCSLPYDVYVSSIPTTCVDLEKTGLLLQALAILSKEYVTPAYYDVSINGKYARDEESIAMLDIILNNVSYDIGSVFDWGGIRGAVCGEIDKKGEFSSFYAKKEASVIKAMEKSIENFEKLK